MNKNSPAQLARRYLSRVAWINADLALSATIEPLAQGGHNTQLKVTILGRELAFRLPAEPAYVGYFAEESHNIHLAVVAGLAPRLFHFDSEKGAMLCDCLAGESLASADLSDLDLLRRIGRFYDRLHEGPQFRYKHDPIGRYGRITRQIEPLDPSLRKPLLSLRGEIDRLLVAYRWHPSRYRPCHNDPFPRNFFDRGDHLLAIDWQVSGQSDPAIEIGGFCNHGAINAVGEEAINEGYRGRPKELWRARLGRVFSSFHYGLRAARDCLPGHAGRDGEARLKRRIAELEALLNRPETDQAASALSRA